MTPPQFTVLLMIFVSLLLNANYHGKPKEGKHNFWTAFIAGFIWIVLLYWGNFFN
jgi:hypothetical protein